MWREATAAPTFLQDGEMDLNHVLLLKTSWHRIEWLKTIKDEQWPAFWSKICPIAMVKSWSHGVIPLKSHRFVVCLSPWFYPISRLDLEDAKTSSTSATSSTEVRQVEGKMSINVPYWAILSHYNTVNMGINGNKWEYINIMGIVLIIILI